MAGMSEQAPKRRWFRFGLLTMFVVVTVFGCWLGWQVNLIRQRGHEREWLKARHAAIYEVPYGVGLHGAVVFPPATQHIPWSLWIAGELPVKVIDSPSMTRSDLERIQRAFPEATVHVGVDGFYTPLYEPDLTPLLREFQNRPHGR